MDTLLESMRGYIGTKTRSGRLEKFIFQVRYALHTILTSNGDLRDNILWSKFGLS